MSVDDPHDLSTDPMSSARTGLRWLRCPLGPDAPAGRFWSSPPYAANPRYAGCVDALTGRAESLG